MAGTKISALTAVASATGADEFPVNEAGTTKKSTLTQLLTWVQSQAWAPDLTLASRLLFPATGKAVIGPAGTFAVRNNADSVDILTVTNAGAVSTFNVLTVGAGLTVTGHVISALVGTPSTSALGANVSSVTFTGNDTRGTIAIVMSGALAANTRIATCTFAASYGATAPILMLANETAGVGLGSINFYRLAVSTGVSFDLASDFALAAGTYTCAYIAIG